MNNSPIILFVWGVAMTVISSLLVYALRHWTSRRGILDVPNDRSSHDSPTPRGGGLAIAVIVLPVWTLAAANDPNLTWIKISVFAVSAAIVAAISWLDDVRGMSRTLRFVTHFAAGLSIVSTFGHFPSIDLPVAGCIAFPAWFGNFVTAIWIVGLTNAYNFMDGIDGIAGGQAVAAGIGWTIVGSLLGEPAAAFLGLSIAASCLGFLFHNWSPAKIFMGDVGSAFLGFTFAFLPVWVGQKNMRLAEFGMLFVWPFILDSAFTFFRRLLKRENVFDAHRSHLYQRLVRTGMTHRRVSGLYIALAVFGWLPAIADLFGGKTASWHFALAVAVLFGGLLAFTVRREKIVSIIV